MKKQFSAIMAISAVIVLFSSLLVLGSCSKSEPKKNSLETLKENNIQKYAGTYTTTDAVGTEFTFTLTEEGKVTCVEEWKSVYAIADSYSRTKEYSKQRQKESKKHYGYWERLSNDIECEVVINDGPNVYFSANDGTYGGRYYIKDGYLYTDMTDCKSENPNKRLKLNKR